MIQEIILYIAKTMTSKMKRRNHFPPWLIHSWLTCELVMSLNDTKINGGNCFNY